MYYSVTTLGLPTPLTVTHGYYRLLTVTQVTLGYLSYSGLLEFLWVTLGYPGLGYPGLLWVSTLLLWVALGYPGPLVVTRGDSAYSGLPHVTQGFSGLLMDTHDYSGY